MSKKAFIGNSQIEKYSELPFIPQGTTNIPLSLWFQHDEAPPHLEFE